MDWQQIVALTIVALAALWLLRTQILAPRRGGCGGCGSCGSAAGSSATTRAKSTQIVQIELELPNARRAANREQE
jgi:FeoB-associated Cys-rich membrane protein